MLIVVGSVLCMLFCYVGYQAITAFVEGRRNANALVTGLHAAMDAGEWDQIYRNAAWGYRSSTTEEDSRHLFEAIQRKLGHVRSTAQTATRVNVTPTGSYLTATFDTSFESGERAEETIVWQSYGRGYRLFGYRVNSLALVTR